MESSINHEKYILTFGYGNRKNYDTLLKYLKKYAVKCIIDVRIKPRAWSRKWYAEKLKEFCDSNNIQYISKTSLGNTSGKENWIPPDEEKAEEALYEVADIAEKGTVLLLCAEMDYHRCHRAEVATSLSELVKVGILHLK